MKRKSDMMALTQCGWRLTNVRPLRNRIPCKGNLKLWTMDSGLSKRVLTEI